MADHDVECERSRWGGVCHCDRRAEERTYDTGELLRQAKAHLELCERGDHIELHTRLRAHLAALVEHVNFLRAIALITAEERDRDADF